jgi:hypothetical protein
MATSPIWESETFIGGRPRLRERRWAGRLAYAAPPNGHVFGYAKRGTAATRFHGVGGSVLVADGIAEMVRAAEHWCRFFDPELAVQRLTNLPRVLAALPEAPAGAQDAGSQSN